MGALDGTTHLEGKTFQNVSYPHMDTPRIFCDFNKRYTRTKFGLNTAGTRKDLERLEQSLTLGLRLTLDARRRALLVEGTHAAQVALLFAVQVVQGHRGFGS